MKPRNARNITEARTSDSFPCVSVPSVVKEFSYKNVAFDYHLICEDRKTVAASVLPSQAIVLKVPIKATNDHIDDFLRRKFRWILKQRRFFAQFKVRPEKRYVSGETFRYRGRSYKLLIREDANKKRIENRKLRMKNSQSSECVSLQHGTLTVFTAQQGQPDHSKALLDGWFRDKAHAVFAQRLEVCLGMFDYEDAPGLMVRPMTRRWGSYSQRTNRVILNQELIKAATRHIDYVIIHELCHIRHRKHNRAFYELLASKLPQWQRLKAELELSLLG